MSVITPELDGSVFVADDPANQSVLIGALCPVVRIIHPASPAGFLEINASDFDPEIHTLFDGDVVVDTPAGRFVHP
jgi:hypothetical protein